MKAWIEVSSDYRFEKKIAGESVLIAPASNRYINMMKSVKTGDLVLHYIIKPGAKKEHESSIIAISIVKTEMYNLDSRVTIDLKEITTLPKPIKLSEIKGIKTKSANLKKLISMNLLRYLSEINKADLINILKIHEENYQHLCSLPYYKEKIVRRKRDFSEQQNG